MQINRLHLRNLRCLNDVNLHLSPGVNLFVGENGVGKTSLLEGLHLMAYGRSFRGRVRDGLIRSGQSALEVFIAWQTRCGRQRRAGLQHTGQHWKGMLDGQAVTSLGALCAAVKVITFEPGSHALVSGGGQTRRRFLDWGLFHVEPGFLSGWRRYMHTLKQRNALLKRSDGVAQLDVWDIELADAGHWLDQQRQRYVARLQFILPEIVAQLAPSLGMPTLRYQPGWRREELSLADALLLSRERDCNSGFTTLGPHRGDWKIEFATQGEVLSRGQAKLAALCCLMTQAADCAAYAQGEWPVMVLDDIASELDPVHRARVLAYLSTGKAQVVVSSTELPPSVAGMSVFHVKHGGVEALG